MRYVAAFLLALAIGGAIAIPAAFAQNSPFQDPPSSPNGPVLTPAGTVSPADSGIPYLNPIQQYGGDKN